MYKNMYDMIIVDDMTNIQTAQPYYTGRHG